jgi:glycerol-3-phosphate acyltransferase PlsY
MLNRVSWVMFLAGPTVGAAYLLSSLSRHWVVDGRDRGSPAVVTEVASTLVVAASAWLVIRSQAPGRTAFQNASAIGFLSSQVLTVWESLALWAGLAAIVGQVAPMTKRFRSGSSGVAGGLALLLVFLPLTALAAAGAWFSSLAVARAVRPSLALSYFAVVVAEWIFGVLNPPGPWGLVHGPETTLFVAVLAGVLTFRWAEGDIG